METLNPSPVGGIPTLEPFDEEVSDFATPWRVTCDGDVSNAIRNSNWQITTPYFKTKGEAAEAWNKLFPTAK